jgi:imidazoleglycerol-phosphate dehydratase/histidinol-phosphatase
MSERILFVEETGGLVQAAAASATDIAGMADLRLVPGAFAALSRFVAAGYRLVLLVDPGDRRAPVARATRDRFEPFLDALLASQGIDIAARQACGHTESPACDCALPGIGLVADYVADAGLDRSRSLVVGDRDATLVLARAMGVAGFRLDGECTWIAVAHERLDRPRRARVARRTRETDIVVEVDLDLADDPKVATGIGFFDHMLEQLGKHGGFALNVACRGDLAVDEHHTIEDVALALGQALKEALGDKRGIGRYGFLLPMDEARAQVALDLSGRAYGVFEAEFPRESVGGMPTELVGHFFRSLAEAMGAALHVSVSGENAHHMIEACFKGVARTLRQAIARAGSDLPSTKGTL